MSRGRGSGAPRLRWLTFLTLMVALSATVAGVVGARAFQARQERRLLQERAAEVGLSLSQSLGAVPARLQEQGAVLAATDRSTRAFDKVAHQDVLTHGGIVAFAWLRPQGGGRFTVLAAQGQGLEPGQVVSDERANLFQAALTHDGIVASPILGARRLLGFALGPPAAPPGTLLYQQSTLGPAIQPPRRAGTDPFSELDVVLYDGTAPALAQAVVSTSPRIPLNGQVVSVRLPVGSDSWLLTVKARQTLAGGLASSVDWLALSAGLAGSVLLAAFVEIAARRRDVALTLYRLERSRAETLQRSLLPVLPEIPKVQLASRYLAGDQGQQVGGDWFDVFPVLRGGIGFVIGDVMGHDLVAASGMAQVRAALRAYAYDGHDPAAVVDHLDALVTDLGMIELATLFYGLLAPAASDGSRLVRWSNAGHLAPLWRSPDGSVQALTGGESVLIGAPVTSTRTSGSLTLPSGSTLLLYTDGLVETPGVSLDDAIGRVGAALSRSHASLEELCDRILSTTADRPSRDDTAILVITLTGDDRPQASQPAGAVGTHCQTPRGELHEGLVQRRRNAAIPFAGWRRRSQAH